LCKLPIGHLESETVAKFFRRHDGTERKQFRRTSKPKLHASAKSQDLDSGGEIQPYGETKVK